MARFDGPASAPRLWFQRVPETKTVKNRVHLDLCSAEPEAEIKRLVGLGARVLPNQASDDVTVLADPEGNELCVLRQPDTG